MSRLKREDLDNVILLAYIRSAWDRIHTLFGCPEKNDRIKVANTFYEFCEMVMTHTDADAVIEVDVSPAHVQRLEKRYVGISYRSFPDVIIGWTGGCKSVKERRPTSFVVIEEMVQKLARATFSTFYVDRHLMNVGPLLFHLDCDKVIEDASLNMFIYELRFDMLTRTGGYRDSRDVAPEHADDIGVNVCFEGTSRRFQHAYHMFSDMQCPCHKEVDALCSLDFNCRPIIKALTIAVRKSRKHPMDYPIYFDVAIALAINMKFMSSCVKAATS